MHRHLSIDRRLLGIPFALLLLPVFGAAPEAQINVIINEQKIAQNQGGFVGPLDDGDRFGRAVSPYAVFEVDEPVEELGIGEVGLAVGASLDDDGGVNRGAVWLLNMDTTGIVSESRKLSDTTLGPIVTLDDRDRFGSSVANLGDLDGDNVQDLAVGAALDDDGATDSGAVWILFMNVDGTAKGAQKLSSTLGGFGGNLDAEDRFGTSLANIGDLDGDGVPELAVGADGDDDGAVDAGAVWVVFMNTNGTAKAWQKISNASGGGGAGLMAGDRFGFSAAPIGDIDLDGVFDLAVGAPDTDDGGNDRGGVWILHLQSDGKAKQRTLLSDNSGCFIGDLADLDRFGSSVATIGDFNDDRIDDLLIGAIGDDGAGLTQGAGWIVTLNADGTARSSTRFTQGVGGLAGPLTDTGRFGIAFAAVGDLDGNGVTDFVAGNDDSASPGFGRTGAIWALFGDDCPPATADTFNGSGVNPVILTADSGPPLGGKWCVSVDASGHAPATVSLVVVAGPNPGVSTSVGELLINPSGGLRFGTFTMPHTGGPVDYKFDIPSLPRLCGFEAFAQAVVFGAPQTELTNRLDLVIGF